MKRSHTLVLLPLVAGIAVWFGTRNPKPELPAGGSEPTKAAPALPPPTTTSTDAVEVFKRAFWRRPTDADRILHAERREWADEDGVDRWQWFIAVEASEGLLRYLIDENPFSLAEPSGKAAIPDQPRPEWFPANAEGCTARQSRDGQMLFLVQKEKGTIFATSQGRGFAKPIQAVAPPEAQVPSESGTAGRIPADSPPVAE